MGLEVQFIKRACCITGLYVFLVGGLLCLSASNSRAQDSASVDPASIDSVQTDSVSYDSLLTYYPALYRDIASRSADSLWPWLQHEVPAIRHQAWRGLMHAEVSDIYQMELEAESSNTPVAWFVLSHFELNKDLRRILEQRWGEGEHLRGGISRVLGKQGDHHSLRFLIDHIDKVRGTEHAFETALAIGRLSREHGLTNSEQFKVIQTAFTSGNVHTARAYLYGAYRADTTIFSPEIRQNLFRLWRVYGVGREPDLDQYLVKILGQSYPEVIMQQFAGAAVDSMDVQLAIELSNLVGQSSVDSTSVRLTNKLLEHFNPRVVSVTLDNLRSSPELIESAYPAVKFSLLQDPSVSGQVWGEALKTFVNIEVPERDSIDHYVDRLDSLRRENMYLLPVYLDVKRQWSNRGDYLDQIDSLLQSGNSLTSTFAARELVDFWEGLDETDRSDRLISRVRSLMSAAMQTGDRGTVYEISSLMSDGLLLGDEGLNRIRQTLEDFKLPGDIEVFQALTEVIYDRYKQQGRGVIDSLASLGSASLNRSLKEMGWEILQDTGDSITSIKKFRVPDWDRLAELGPNPRWTLRMKDDTIRIRLDPLRAPFTVSAIDSLTRAGAYDSVAFHRVVPNFVVQGGDIERGDGFGGPSFTIPTEPSELHYHRGSVGIASAGIDTEGSQYFIMHQWKPHLNGNYTRFGVVVEGMDAVDEITVGDMVLEANIESSRLEAGGSRPN